MLVVETVGRIRREHLVKGKSIKEIARDLKISRNTVRKVLRSGATSFEYEREVQPRPKLGRWSSDLDRLLTLNTTKASRERLTLIRIFEELRALGYEGGYDAVRRYARLVAPLIGGRQRRSLSAAGEGVQNAVAGIQPRNDRHSFLLAVDGGKTRKCTNCPARVNEAAT